MKLGRVWWAGFQMTINNSRLYADYRIPVTFYGNYDQL